jgi:hypothetical protein
MGHSRFDITMDIYTGSVPAALREAADSLDSMFQHAVCAGCCMGCCTGSFRRSDRVVSNLKSDDPQTKGADEGIRTPTHALRMPGRSVLSRPTLSELSSKPARMFYWRPLCLLPFAGATPTVTPRRP